MVKYDAHVTSIGPLLGEFREGGVLVFFGLNAPAELAEFAVLHDGQHLVAPVEPGDWFQLDTARFEVLAVGDIANRNLDHSGHFILKFNGQTEPEMPGDICVEHKPVPDVHPGMHLQILGKTPNETSQPAATALTPAEAPATPSASPLLAADTAATQELAGE